MNKKCFNLGHIVADQTRVKYINPSRSKGQNNFQWPKIARDLDSVHKSKTLKCLESPTLQKNISRVPPIFREDEILECDSFLKRGTYKIKMALLYSFLILILAIRKLAPMFSFYRPYYTANFA